MALHRFQFFRISAEDLNRILSAFNFKHCQINRELEKLLIDATSQKKKRENPFFIFQAQL